MMSTGGGLKTEIRATTEHLSHFLSLVNMKVHEDQRKAMFYHLRLSLVSVVVVVVDVVVRNHLQPVKKMKKQNWGKMSSMKKGGLCYIFQSEV